MARRSKATGLKPVNGTFRDDLLDLSFTTVAQKINGGDGHDTIFGGSGGDFINAGDGDDWVSGGAGNDVMFGNGGYDTASFSGSILDFHWAEGKGNSLIVTDMIGAGGRDRLKHFEVLEFDDYSFVLGGDNATLIQAANQVTDEDSPVDFSVDAFDFDGTSLKLVSATATGGTLSGTGQSSLSPAMGVGSRFDFNWNPGAEFQYLAVDESAFVTVSFVVEDDAGNLSARDISIMVEGVNDDPEITGVVYTQNSVTEDGVLVASGMVNATDIDQTDELSFSVVGSATSAYGTFGIDGDGKWTFTLNNDAAAVQALGSGDTITDTFTVEVSDGNGGTDTVDISVAVNGADDANALLIDFEDLSSGSYWGFIPLGYKGFSWTSSARFLETDEFSVGSYGISPTSGDNIMYNAFGGDVVLNRSSDFDLESASVTSARLATQTFFADAYDDGAFLGRQSFTITNSGPQTLEFDDALFDSVDRVVFGTPGGSLTQFAMDDLLVFV